MSTGARVRLMWLSIAMVAVLIGGGIGTYALFSAMAGPAAADLQAGTVSLGSPTTSLVNVTDMAPGDSDTKQYAVTYTGSLDAWLLLDTTLTGDLTTCDGGKFTFTITDNAGKSYLANAQGQVARIVSTGTTTTFSLDYALDLSAGNPCQAKDATFTIRVRAVQARNNTLPDNSGPTSDGSLIVHGFEIGGFSGWDVYVPPGGSADIVTGHNGYSAQEGSHFALLKTDGPGSYTTASRDFTVGAGATVSGTAFFWDAEGGSCTFNDNAHIVIRQGATVVATVWSASSCSTGTTPWQTWTHTFAAGGTYTVEARIANVGDSVVDSYMGLDGVTISN